MELQAHMREFEARGVAVVAVSFDSAQSQYNWAYENGFTFTLASDPEGQVIDTYHLRDRRNLGPASYHAVYLIDPGGEIFYRKIGRRRPDSRELFRALAHEPFACCPGNCGETICEALE